MARDFNVPWLKDWSFCFQVSDKSVGIMIHHLRSYVGKHFLVHFALWCNGGPDWRRELTKWETLQDAEWHQVSCRKKSFVAAVQEQRRPGLSRGSGAARQLLVFKCLRYPHDYFQKNFAAGSSAMDFQKDSIHKNYAADAAFLVHQKDLHHPRLSLWVPKFTGDNRSGTAGGDIHCAPDVLARNPRLGAGFQQHSNGYSNSKIKSADRRVSRPSQSEVSCPRCLIARHLSYACKNLVHCLSCGHSGHYACNCSTRTKRGLLRPTRPNSLPSISTRGYKGNLVWRLKGASSPI
jgi:hypothetical protein